MIKILNFGADAKQMSIRDRYIGVVQNIFHEISPHQLPGVGFAIPRDASLESCIQYTLKFILKEHDHDRYSHYRYDRYQRVLKSSLIQLAPSERKFVHVDIGCGPGLFTWVVHDLLIEQNKADVRFYGYDHAPNMVRLAQRIWKKLNTGLPLNCFDDQGGLMQHIQGEAPPYTAIVTFGYVLIQTNGNNEAIEGFAQTLGMLANMSKNCIVVAVDGTSRDHWPETFRSSCHALNEVLSHHDLTINFREESYSEMSGDLVRIRTRTSR